MLSEGLLPDGTRYLHAAPMFHLADWRRWMFAIADRRRHQRDRADLQSAGVMAAIEKHEVTDLCSCRP